MTSPQRSNEGIDWLHPKDLPRTCHEEALLVLMVIYPKLCSLFTRRFAHFPEVVNSLEKRLTTPQAEAIF